MATARKPATKATTDQPADAYPELATPPEPAPEPAKAEHVFDPKRMFGMIWLDGLKHYLQDGIIYDRGDRRPIGQA